jgi:hypothetical protein
MAIYKSWGLRFYERRLLLEATSRTHASSSSGIDRHHHERWRSDDDTEFLLSHDVLFSIHFL